MKDCLRKFATDGLRISASDVQRHLQNNQNDISEAAHRILTEWHNTQDDDETAFHGICDALHRVGMKRLAKELKSMS